MGEKEGPGGGGFYGPGRFTPVHWHPHLGGTRWGVGWEGMEPAFFCMLACHFFSVQTRACNMPCSKARVLRSFFLPTGEKNPVFEGKVFAVLYRRTPR